MLANDIQQTISAGGTDIITLSTAVSGWVTVGDRFSDGDYVKYRIENANGDLERGYGIWTAAGSSFARTIKTEKIVSGVITANPTTGITATTDSIFYCDASVEDLTDSIVGIGLEYVSSTSIKCLQGYAHVNGEILTVPAAGITTITGDALAGTAIYYIYIYNDAGTVKLHREARGSSADDPVWDYEFDYAKHSADGLSKRCIGAVYVDTGVYKVFQTAVKGRTRLLIEDQFIERVVGGLSSTTATPVPCETYIPALSICKAIGVKLHVRNDTGGNSLDTYVIFSQTSTACNINGGAQVSAQLDNASAATALGPMMIPCNDTTFFYRVKQNTVSGFVDINIWELYI